MMNEDEKSRPRDMETARAGWVRVERGVRPLHMRLLTGELRKDRFSFERQVDISDRFAFFDVWTDVDVVEDKRIT
jgi:hypothetical protein